MLDLNPTEVTDHFKARTDGVSSSDMLGADARPLELHTQNRLPFFALRHFCGPSVSPRNG